MAAGYPGRDLRGSFGYGSGSAVQFPYQQRSDGGSSGLLKRSLTELEWQQQIQHAFYLRSVKQRTSHLNSPMSPLSSIDLSSSSSSSLSSSSGINFNFLRAQHQHQHQHQQQQQQQQQQQNQCLKPPDFSFLTPAAEFEKKPSAIKNQLQELERQLLLDDDDDDDVSVTGSAVTTREWGEAMQQLITPSPSPPPPPQNPLSPSQTTSTSSSSSSSASCSPTPPSAPSKQLLLDTAAAISEGNLETATANIAALKRAANPRGDPDQRLAAMMVSALVERISPPPVTGASPITELCSTEQQAATQMLYELSPYFKLGVVAANSAILDATRDQSKIHIVDFDLGQGLQYASLINAIAERSRHRSSFQSPPFVKITAVCDPTFLFNTLSTVNNLKVIGNKITRLAAERFGLTVRFNVVNRRTTELDRAALGCEPDEALAVNFAFVLSRIADESVSPANPRDELLRRVKSLDPNVVTMVEQEMNANTAPFAARFTEACNHYSSILDSFEATMSRDQSNRVRIRIESCLARKAANSIAREGADRIERPEVLGKWRARMSMAGLKPVPFGPAVSEPVKALFGSMKANPGFTYKEEAGWLGFGWMGRVLTVASAWH